MANEVTYPQLTGADIVAGEDEFVNAAQLARYKVVTE